MPEVFITRQQYDWLLVNAYGFMRNIWPNNRMLVKKWTLAGVTVTAVGEQHIQHISRLRGLIAQCPIS